MKFRVVAVLSVIAFAGSAFAAPSSSNSAGDTGRQASASNSLGVTSTLSKSSAEPSCEYDGKAYSEGAILPVAHVSLMCVERDWGYHDQNSARELVWEPLSSDRLSELRSMMRLPAALTEGSRK